MTRGVALLIFAFCLAAVAGSQLLLKGGMARIANATVSDGSVYGLLMKGLSEPLMWIGGFLLVTGGLAWYVAMIRLPLSLMMPMAALIAPAVSVGAAMFFGEPLTSSKIAAIVLIVSGAVWLGALNS